MKKDRIDVEPCYPLLSAELESAEALTSSQQKFQTLNLADYKVMRQLLPMTLVWGVWFRILTGRLILFVDWNFPACNG